MGICTSKPIQTPVNAATSDSKSPQAQALADQEFREILKNVTLIILEKLATALDVNIPIYPQPSSLTR